MEDYEQIDKTENNVSEPQAAYETAMEVVSGEGLHIVGDHEDFNDEAYFKQLRVELEEYYVEERSELAKNPLPEGYMSLEEFDKLLQKKLKERYAEIYIKN